MPNLSRSIAVKSIIKYPREAQVGKTYLMTIDLQPEENFEWQYEEEEYPVYCSVNSDLFSSKPVGEPVIVLHRFGGSYGAANFLIETMVREAESNIRITLSNRWGAPIQTLILTPKILNDNSTVNTEIPDSDNLDELIFSHSSSLQDEQSKSRNQSTFILTGGAEDKIGDRWILRAFLNYAGSTSSKIVIIPNASLEPEIVAEQYCSIFRDIGAGWVEIVNLKDDYQYLGAVWGRLLEECTGIFLCPGDQSHLKKVLIESPIIETLRRRIQSDLAVLGGSDAGSAILGRHMVSGGGSGESPNRSLVDTCEGLEVLSGVLIDQHFFNRNRMARLLSAVAIHPDNLGIGIDEDTCIVLENDQTFRVIGKESVTIIDPGELSYTNSSSVDTSQPLSIHNLRVHILTNGDCYDIDQRLTVYTSNKSSEAVVSLPSISKQGANQPKQASTTTAIMAIGGAEDKVHDRLILHTFFERSGSTEARLAIIPSASREPAVIGERYRNVFEEMGARSIEVIDVREREQGADPNWRAYIETCTGVFLTGGDQLRFCGLLADTPILEKIRTRAQLGEITLAGTSAGLPVFGQYMIAGGGSGEPPNRSLVDLTTGLGIVPEVIWDQHFHNRNRISRLISAVAAYPEKLGIGIDEDTCVVLEDNNLFRVIGKGSVTVIDPTEVSFNNWNNITETAPISIHNLRVHILTHGDQFSLRDREAFSPNGYQSQIRENSKEFEQLESSPSKLDYLQRLADVISSDEFSIKSAIESELENALHGKEVESYEIPDDNNQATVESVGEIQTIDLDVSVIEYFNDEKLVIPFKLQVECLLQYFIYKADYYALDEERRISIDDWNDHYFMAEEHYPLKVEGVVAVKPDLESIEFSELSDDDVMDLLADADVSIESLTHIEVISR